MRYGKVLPGYQYIGCHMIFYIKMGVNFTRKSFFIADGHSTDLPGSIDNSSGVSRDIMRIVFIHSALNNIDVIAANIGNAYLNASCSEEIWTKDGPKFGSHIGHVMLIVREL